MKYSILKRFCMKPIIFFQRRKNEQKRNEDLEKHIRTVEEITLKLKEAHEKFLEFERHSNENETLKYKSQVEILKWVLRKK